MKRANYNRTEENQNNFGQVASNSLKTKNFNKMKTKNNVQKAILKSLVVVTSLVLISITVNAQEYWKSLLENYNFNASELAMVGNSSVAIPVETDANLFVSLIEQETEETLELENWMIDESYFTSGFSIEEEIENPLDLEDWMTNEALFSTNSIYMEVETEEALELENWMTDESYFDNSSIQIIEESDTELILEDWMLNEKLFDINEEVEQPLELESWMVSEKIW